MRWLDDKFKKNRLQYVLQCLLATVAVIGVAALTALKP